MNVAEPETIRKAVSSGDTSYLTKVSGIGKKRIDVHLMNEEHSGWLNCKRFEAYLRAHPKALEEYRLLKESGDGLSTREYYRKKLEFINESLEKNKIHL